MLVNNLKIKQFLKRQEINAPISKIIEQLLLQAKVGNITIHPYGFYIVKIEKQNNIQIRLHIWLDKFRKRQNPDWPPHTHSSDLNSIILNGKLTHNIWEIVHKNQAANVLYQVEYDKNISKLNKTSELVSLQLTNSTLYSTGDSYCLDRYIFHSVEVKNTLKAITLFITSNLGKNVQHVVGEAIGNKVYEFERRKLTIIEKNAVVHEIEKLNQDINT